MSITYFDELQEMKQVVLEMAEIDTNHLKKEEASSRVYKPEVERAFPAR
jgi:hypothetical protein